MLQGQRSKTSLGRDHHRRAFTIWMAGGGIKRGFSLRATARLINEVEKVLQSHGITPWRPRRTEMGGYAPEDLPAELRLAFEVRAGKLLNEAVLSLKADPRFRQADFDQRRAAIQRAMSRARQIAKFQVIQERGLPRRAPRIPSGRERRLPSTLREEASRS